VIGLVIGSGKAAIVRARAAARTCADEHAAGALPRKL